MEYSEPYPSAVPHAILVPDVISMSATYFYTSLVVEIYFLAATIAFFALAIYFRCGNYRMLIDQTGQPKQKK